MIPQPALKLKQYEMVYFSGLRTTNWKLDLLHLVPLIDFEYSSNQLTTHAKAMTPADTIISLTEKLMENYLAIIRQNETD